MRSPRIVLIVDQRRIARWHLRALQSVAGLEPPVVFSCTNTRIRRKLWKHLLYYVLRIVSFSKSWAGKVELAETGFPVKEIVDFESEYDGAWQRLPPDIISHIQAQGADVVLKFGMSLLRVPPDLELPILSYHHGDPEQYRGRPAGFWETLHGRERMGQVVQIISDRLDAGAIVAYAETKIFAHSYRKTMSQAYAHSPLLLPVAIRNAVARRHIPKPPLGRNYRLPGNPTVARFALRQAFSFGAWLVYGAFFEKKWTVARAQASPEAVIEGGEFPPRSAWRNVPQSKRHVFHADPFYIDEPKGILVEGLNRGTGRGELLLIDESGNQRLVCDPAVHCSYPATIHEEGRTYVVPEIARWSEPRIFVLGDGQLEEVGRLSIEGGAKVIDPTLFRHGDRLFLFGNKSETGCVALHLWSSDSLFGRFVEHPASPVMISPFGSRMAGQIVRSNGAIYRLSQDGLRSYGDGAIAFRIEALGPDEYRESFVREIRFDEVRGPHTLNWRGGEILFDWYEVRFAPLAWLRRVRGRLGGKAVPSAAAAARSTGRPAGEAA